MPVRPSNPIRILLCAVLLAAAGSVLALGWGSSPARAEPTHHGRSSLPAPIKPRKAEPGMFYTDQEIDKLEAMTPEDRNKYFLDRSKNFKGMDPADLAKYMSEKRAAFEALPADKQAERNKRIQKLFGEIVTQQKPFFEKNAAEEKKRDDAKAKAFLDALPDYQRAVMLKYKSLRKNHSKEYAWHMILEDAAKGAKLDPIPEKK
jgi:hypothetical protein